MAANRADSVITRRAAALAAWACLSAAVFAHFALAQRPADAPQSNEEAATVTADHPEQMAAGLELFKNGVRVLLTAHCLKCHGGEESEGELNLATREGLLQGGSQGAAIVPGSAAKSLLFRLASHADEPHMPVGAAKLPDDSLALLAKWIDAGAPYDRPLAGASDSADAPRQVTDEDRQFWSFDRLALHPAPSVKNPAWCRTDVDRFVLSALESRGLSPSREADRRKLIRRAYLDLVGLPPTPAEVEEFVADTSADAYEKLVDRLLSNAHHGERWGRHWLDLARFAESHGYEQDYDRPSAYHYRDFIIKALNADMPYDQFVDWQIAGDELAADDPLAMMATGFLGAGTHATQITANQVEKERYDELDDMAATVGTAMLGLTIGCARCHDHKFDPLPQYDYYRFVSTFTTTVRSEVDLDLHPERYREAKEAFDREHAPLADALAAFERDELPARLANWLSTDGKPPHPRWLVVEAKSLTASGGATFARQPDGSYLAEGKNPPADEYAFVVETPLDQLVGLRLEALPDASLPKSGPGRAENGNFALSDLRITAAPLDGSAEPTTVKLIEPQASFEQTGLPVAAAIDDDLKSGWAIDGQIGKRQAASFTFAQPVGFSAGTRLNVTLRFRTNTGHSIGRPRLTIARLPATVALDGDEGFHQHVVDVDRVLKIAPPQRTPEDQQSLVSWFRTTDQEWQKLRAAVDEHLAKSPKPELTKVMVTSEGLPAIRLHTQGADFFEQTYFLKRGDLNQKQGEAAQGFLQMLTPSEQQAQFHRDPPSGARTSFRRASMANWITDVEHGGGTLLARVIVNRLWQHHLGRGIVSTPSDFGSQGARPTHPELLDYLADQLIRNGWRLKPIHRLIMTSSVYRQSAESDPERLAADPDNQWLWRWSRRRLEGEVIRDSMLAASGALDETPFGPGTLDESQRRRSIYFTVKRSQLIPMMVLFDAPEPLQSMGLRGSTTVAPQALLMMNNAEVRKYARELARRVRPAESVDVADAVRQGYASTLGRSPTEQELQTAREFLEQQQARYHAEGKSNAAELALTDYCQTLFSLNEFIFVE